VLAPLAGWRYLWRFNLGNLNCLLRTPFLNAAQAVGFPESFGVTRQAILAALRPEVALAALAAYLLNVYHHTARFAAFFTGPLSQAKQAELAYF
jgi:hypothetical protein